MTAQHIMGRMLARALRHPGAALGVVLELAHGWWCKVWYRLRGIHFHAGRNLRVRGRLVVRGPGTVRLGDNVVIDMKVTPWTYARDAVIEVGDGCYLNGTRFGCQQRITIGADSIVADARIMDTNFHSLRADRHAPGAPVKVSPVVLGRNVWVAAEAGILPGTEIGENSVVGFGSVCSGRYPANMLIAGNPAHPLRPLPEASASQ